MISIVIPTFKNKEQLIQNLNHNMKFFNDCQVIIVNDNPQESLVEALRQFKNLILIENKNNLGFGGSITVGMKRTKYSYVMLLNDDVVLDNANFKKTLGYFKKDFSLFAVSFAQKEKDGKTIGKNFLYWKFGLVHHSKAKNLNFGYNAWAEGGACIVDKGKFLEIGGFDSIYTPFYWEDIDLSYRAWKSGFKIVFDPNILVQHHHESTIGKYFSKKFVKTIAYRNQFIFIWKNITDPFLWFQHVAFLPYNLVYYLIKGELEFVKGFIMALAKKVNE